eukprot:2397290-Amphidinium_carterae.1
MIHGTMYRCRRNFLMHRQRINLFRELSECISDLAKAIQGNFTIPKTKRDNLKDTFDVRSVLFGAYTKQGSGCSHACSKMARSAESYPSDGQD